MSFDPNKPVVDAPLDAVEMRGQLNGLKDLIDAVPNSQALADVLTAQTAGHCEYLPPPSFTVSNPPTQAEVQAIANFVNDLYVALSRS